MDNSQSRARPASGSHPPKSKNSLRKYFVSKIVGALAVLTCAASVASAQAGTTISGTVTNEQGVPLPGATVLIQGTTTGAHTDDAGRYVIVVPADRANGQSGVLVARVIGYSARQVPIVLAAGSTISQNFALVVNPLNLDAVLVTGAGTSTTRERLTTTINTVDSARSHARPIHKTSSPLWRRRRPTWKFARNRESRALRHRSRSAARRLCPERTSRCSSSMDSRSTIRRSRRRASRTGPGQPRARTRALSRRTARRTSTQPTSSPFRF